MFTARSINMLDWVDVTNASATTRIYPMMSNHIARAHHACRGALWRRDRLIPRMKRWWTQRGSAAGEDPEFGALHECALHAVRAVHAKPQVRRRPTRPRVGPTANLEDY